MSTKPTTARNQNILSPEEVAICQSLAKLDIKLVSQRAQALLLIHEGTTQVDTAEKSGLTLGQVRYLMIIYRKNGMNLFPEKLLSTIAAPAPEAEPKKKPVKEKKGKTKAKVKDKKKKKEGKAKEKKKKPVKKDKKKKDSKKKAKKKKKK